jgi:hypothetical protein
MRVRCILERKSLVDVHLHGARLHDVEHLLGTLLDLGAVRQVGVLRRARQEQRTLLVEDADVDAVPNSTIRPSGLMQSSERMKVSLPIES